MVVLFLLAILGFTASLAVHLSTYLGAPPVGIGQVWPLHIGVFLVFIPVVLAQPRNAKTAAAEGPRGAPEQFAYAPGWMRAVLGCCFVYAIVNFLIFLCIAPGRDETISFHDGRYAVLRRGEVVREATEEENHRQEATIARGFSGHWMLFYWLGVVGIYDGLRRRRAEEAARLQGPPLGLGSQPEAARPAGLRPSPWLHATIASILSLVGFFAGPLSMNALMGVLWPASPEAPRPGSAFCCLAPMLLASAILGLVLPGLFFARLVAARCPCCAGRCFCGGGPLFGASAYVCRDCGQSCSIQGSGKEEES
jgi:hypothetical protein